MIFSFWCMSFSYFCKNVLPAYARNTFLKTNSEQSAFKNTFVWSFECPKWRISGAIFLAFIALLPVRFIFFRLQSPIRILIFAWKNVYFCFWSPISKTTTSITLANLWFLQILLRICIKIVVCKMHVRYFFCSAACCFHIFAKMCSPPSVGSTFLKTDAKQHALKNVSFEPLLAALALSIPLRRALFRH